MPLPSLQKEPLHGYLGFKVLDIKAFMMACNGVQAIASRVHSLVVL